MPDEPTVTILEYWSKDGTHASVFPDGRVEVRQFPAAGCIDAGLLRMLADVARKPGPTQAGS